ncbi:MAG TPA: prepilin-type N-terminal cleavage/methylation domain-containing protein [Acidimicrobiales bacterium]|nr:prepilin-type N-terminal cleavage/methylation domain-containing protein [Acidimicrobiales bacterium]
MRKRLERDEDGFTLIELMVVVLIIAILLAIAIPTFLGARNRANQRAAQSSLRNALTGAKTIYTDNQDYTQASAAALATGEPSLTFVVGTASSTDFKVVSVDATATGAWGAAALSKDNTCYYIYDNPGGGKGTFYGSTPNSSSTTCLGSAAAGTATLGKW